MRTTVAMFAMAALLAGCTNDNSEQAANGADADVAAGDRTLTLVSGEGGEIGTVSLREEASGIMINVNVDGLEAGSKAVHLHAVGDCSASDFTSAGGHWNPQNKEHGRDNSQGAHLGDLANLTVDEDGTGQSQYLVTGVSLSGNALMIDDDDGTALVIHAGPDDYRSDPAGDAGERIACAVISAAG